MYEINSAVEFTVPVRPSLRHEVSRFAALVQMPEALREAAAQNAPIRALSDLNALWKKDAQAVMAFLARTDAGDISRRTVDRLKAEIEAKTNHMEVNSPSAAPSEYAAPYSYDRRHVTDVPPEKEAEKTGQGPNRLERPNKAPALSENPSQTAALGSFSLLVCHNGLHGRVLLDRPASDTKSLFVSFEDGAQVEEIAIIDLQPIEVLRQ